MLHLVSEILHHIISDVQGITLGTSWCGITLLGLKQPYNHLSRGDMHRRSPLT